MVKKQVEKVFDYSIPGFPALLEKGSANMMTKSAEHQRASGNKAAARSKVENFQPITRCTDLFGVDPQADGDIGIGREKWVGG